MRCARCFRAMAKDRNELLDRYDDLRITAWHCTACGGRIEEIRVLPPQSGGKPRRVRYAVRPWSSVA
jgi:hypothetical protein